jgi:hypothetical protein
MNERIQELAKQAGHRYYPSSNSGPLRVEYLTPELEKFAELIVQKCADIGALKADGNYEVYNSIVEYFGMQEPEE